MIQHITYSNDQNLDCCCGVTDAEHRTRQGARTERCQCQYRTKMQDRTMTRYTFFYHRY